MATEIMLRRSLRLRRPNAALPRTTTHDDIKPVNPVYASKHGGDLDPVCDHPNTPVTSTTTISTSARHKHQNDNLDCPRHQCLDDINPIPSKHQVDDLNLPRRKHTTTDLDLDFDMASVRSIGYRINCLRPNGIHFHLPSDTLPHVVALITNQILTAAPHPPAMLVAMMDELERLSTCGGYELSLRNCFSRGLFPATLRPELCIQFEPFLPRHLIPTHPNAPYALPQPRPDLLYGYSIWTAFTETQQTTFQHLHPQNRSYAQAAFDLYFPFFVVELKAAAGTGGNLWDAANQCAGGATACLQAVHQLNTTLSAAGCQGSIPNLCYSLAIDNNLGQLYVSWKDSLAFHTRRVASFLLSDPQHFGHLCACVAAILEWGATARLQDIRAAADYISG
jgi:hypothetical protein